MTTTRDDVDALAAENAKLRKINAALMARVERSMDRPVNAFGLFEAAIALDTTVRRRTHELQSALRAIERTNEALNQAKQRADSANSFKSTFLAFVGHDLLQPLNAARLGLSALMESARAHDCGPIVAQVDRALTSLEDLIRTLLDISKLDAGVMRPDVCAFEIERVIGPLRLESKSLAAARGLKLHVRPSRAIVRSDPLLLRRVLQNLLNNALRYTRSGGVLLGCRKRGDQLRIEIVDTGPGIPADRREAIFEEFHREAGAGPAAVGFGLGLSIVRRLALALDHPVDLVSRVGHGSVFSVNVPIGAPEAVVATGASDATPAHYGLDGANVLIIENDPSVEQAMSALLVRWGCKVFPASSGAEARAAARGAARKLDLIIADLHLNNGERGFEAISAIQSDLDFPVPALVVTADHAESATAEAAARGVEILRKPVKPAELRSLMAYLLG